MTDVGSAMPSVQLITPAQAPLLSRPYFESGDPGPIVSSLAQVPELLEVAMPFIGRALGPSAISFRDKEIVIVRTSALLKCQYCELTHTAVALDAGLTHDEIGALRRRIDIDAAFDDPRELSLLRWTDAVATGTGAVGHDIRSTLRQHWDDHEVVELTIVITATMLLNRYATSLELPVSAATLDRLAVEGLT
jgi:AhpD family alkylhydroperoxidase